MPFLDDYEPVEERLARFWADHPNGRIFTELVQTNGSVDLGDQVTPPMSVIMVASVYKDKADLYPDATGYAQETPGSNPVNKTSWVENCETSAIGRALANMGYAPKGARPSREEMQKVRGRAAKPPAKPAKARASHIRLFEAAKTAGVDEELRHRITRMLTRGRTASTSDLTDDQADQISAQLAWFGENKTRGMRELEKWEAENE